MGKKEQLKEAASGPASPLSKTDRKAQKKLEKAERADKARHKEEEREAAAAGPAEPQQLANGRDEAKFGSEKKSKKDRKKGGSGSPAAGDPAEAGPLKVGPDPGHAEKLRLLLSSISSEDAAAHAAGQGQDRAGAAGRKRAAEGAEEGAQAASPALPSAPPGYYSPKDRGSIELRPAHSPLRIDRVPELLLWVLGQGDNPQWLFVKNKPLVNKANGVDLELLERRPDWFPHLTGAMLMGRPAAAAAGGASPGPSAAGVPSKAALAVTVSRPDTFPMYQVNQVLRVPARKKVKQGNREDRKKRRLDPPFPPSHYCLTLQQLESFGFPLPVVGEDGAVSCPEGFVATQRPEGAEGAGGAAGEGAAVLEERLIALDCEMVITEEGFELARCTLVDRSGAVLYDKLCRPGRPVKDYNTRYSGITAEMLAQTSTTLQDIQQDFVRLVSSEAILVGHSLENDLRAVRVVHPRVLDTSVSFPHPKGLPWRSALRVITEKILKRKIQVGAHDSAEDARAAMDLALAKIQNGPDFGTSNQGDQDREHVVDILAESGRRTAAVDRPDNLRRIVSGTCSAVPADSDGEAVEKTKKALGTADFVWCQLSGLYEFYEEKWTRRKAAGAAAPAAAVTDGSTGPSGRPPGNTTTAADPPSAPSTSSAHGSTELSPAELQELSKRLVSRTEAPESDPEVERRSRALDGHVASIHAALQPNTLLVVFTGQGDTIRNRRLSELRAKRQSEAAREELGLPPWSLRDEELFNELNQRAATAVLAAQVIQ